MGIAMQMKVADMGGGISRAAAEYGFATDSEEYYGFENVRTAYDNLKAAVEEMMELDRQEANGFWSEVSAWGKHLWNRPAERERFDQDVANLTGPVTASIDNMGATIDLAEGSVAHVPQDLYSAARSWEQTTRNMDTTGSDVSGLQAIPGWGGEAAIKYGESTVVQGGATQELTGVSASVANALIGLGNFNCALFLKAASRLSSAEQTVRGTQSFSGGGGEFYIRTATFKGEVEDCELLVNRILRGDETIGAAEELAAGIQSAVSAPALLERGAWPTGGAQAGVVPSPPMIHNPDLPQTGDPSGGICLAPEEGAHK